MGYSSVVISAGHGRIVRGAVGCGYDEHDEAVKVMNRVAQLLKSQGVTVYTYEETTATSSSRNLSNICNFHNSKSRQLDVSIHFNAGGGTGVETLWLSNDMSSLATAMSTKIASVLGIANRGAKQRTDLYFLRTTSRPAILIETCFIDNKADMDSYVKNFENLCRAIASVISGKALEMKVTEENKPVFRNYIGEVKIDSGFSVNVYNKPNGSYVRKLNAGTYKVYYVDSATGMLNVGNNEWITKPMAHVTYKQFVAVTLGSVNVYSKPEAISANYKRKLGKGTWKIYSVDFKNGMICLGNNEWIIQCDVAYLK